MFGATFVNLIKPHLKGWKSLVIIPMIASSYAIRNASAGWPMWIALSTDLGYHVTYLAALMTVTSHYRSLGHVEAVS